MREEEFSSWLRAGAAQLGGAANPPSPDVIRRRGDRRRRRARVVSGLLAFAIGGGGGGVAYASLAQPGDNLPPAASGTSSTPSASSASSGPAGPEFVGVTTGGAVQLFSVTTGMATTTLVSASDAVGDAVAVSPDGSTVYFTVKRNCQDVIESVPVSGGAPSVVTAGALPAISPDGTKLAFAREPASMLSAVKPGCAGLAGAQPGTQFRVVVRDLNTGSEKAYPAPPGSTALPYPVSHLSWSPSGTTLLVSMGQSQDNEGWDLHLLDIATAKYYLSATWPRTSGADVPVTGSPDAAASYYSEGVFLPDGAIFADRVCCAGVPVRQTSSLLQEIGTTGYLLHQVAIGYPDMVHSSLDGRGDWVLYLAAHDLYAAEGKHAARLITGGLIAATWLPS